MSSDDISKKFLKIGDEIEVHGFGRNVIQLFWKWKVPTAINGNISDMEFSDVPFDLQHDHQGGVGAISKEGKINHFYMKYVSKVESTVSENNEDFEKMRPTFLAKINKHRETVYMRNIDDMDWTTNDLKLECERLNLL